MFKTSPREKKTPNINTTSLIHLRIRTHFISRHPHSSHELPYFLAESQCCSSSYYDNTDVLVLHSLTHKGTHSKNKQFIEDGRNLGKMTFKESTSQKMPL